MDWNCRFACKMRRNKQIYVNNRPLLCYDKKGFREVCEVLTYVESIPISSARTNTTGTA